jgi:flagellar motor switch protein FliN
MPNPAQHLKKLRVFSKDYLETATQPLFPSSPNLDWKSFCDTLKQRLEISKLHIELGERNWEDSQVLLQKFSNPKLTPLSIPSLSGSLFCIFSEETWQQLCWEIISSKNTTPWIQKNSSLMEGMYHFILIEALYAIKSQENWAQLAPQLADPQIPFPTQQQICYQLINITLPGNKTIQATLAFSQELINSWNLFTTNSDKPLPDINITTQIELNSGSVHLSKTQWEQVNLGDFIVLDNCSLLPQQETGIVSISVKGVHLGKASLDQNSLKDFHKE